jgi:hypothetical protein
VVLCLQSRNTPSEDEVSYIGRRGFERHFLPLHRSCCEKWSCYDDVKAWCADFVVCLLIQLRWMEDWLNMYRAQSSRGRKMAAVGNENTLGRGRRSVHKMRC